MKRVILLILDGWGYRAETSHNAVLLSDPINLDRIQQVAPHILIGASGESVGLPAGQMGNSEVGHTNIGAGRVVYQDLLKITKAFEDDSVRNIQELQDFFKKAGKGGRLHLLGLLSDGGVHSHISHFKGVAKLAKSMGVKDIFIHALTDGRDTPPNSAVGYVEDLEKWLKENNTGCLSDICGRFYGMDRDKHWERIEESYQLLRNGIVDGACNETNSLSDALRDSYSKGITDEFIEPTKLSGVDGRVKDGDSLIFMNFRSDRVREMLAAFYADNFDSFNRGAKPAINIITMTEYDESIAVPVIFRKEELIDTLGEVLSKHGLRQLRIAETEKYAHVTFFFNGGREESFEGERRILVPSPRDVATYDLKPEMSIANVVDKFRKAFYDDDLDVVIMNFANPDMVGHTGVELAAIDACKIVDVMVGSVANLADEMDAVLIITADHGNSEEMWDEAHNQPHTAHTTNPVPLIIYNYKCQFIKDSGKLADIAPTILAILGLPVPQAMTGDILVKPFS
ncbi:2,3-bisphosphoglycerate-independent phosphoglycerate mutase [Deferribacterales bacterium RsTz2092]